MLSQHFEIILFTVGLAGMYCRTGICVMQDLCDFDCHRHYAIFKFVITLTSVLYCVLSDMKHSAILFKIT